MQDQSCSIEKRLSLKQRSKGFQIAKFCSLIFLALGILVTPVFASPGTITLVAGISTLAGTGSPGLATSPTQANTAPLLGPVALETDAAGNVYLADGQFNTVWKINRQTGIMAIFAGIPGPSGQTGDGGPATSAKFRGPEGIRIDQAGNVYIVDTGNFAVRKVDTNGVITTYAGRLHVSGYTGDGGAATSATLGGPSYIALDHAGNLYISDLINNVIRKVDATTHIITTVAGNNTSGFSGDGGQALSAQLNSPNGLQFDSKGNLYITDRGNNVVRQVAAGTNVITTVAGTGGSSGSTGDGGPATSALLNFPWSIAIDSSDNLYIGDFLNGAVRKVDAISGVITTVAGTIGSQGNSGDGGPATLAQLSNPTDLAFDRFGHLYVADLISTTVREVDFQPSFPKTAVGSTSNSQNLILNVTGTLTIDSITVPNSLGGNPEYSVGSLTGTGCSIGSPIVGGVNGIPCVLPVTFSPLFPGTRPIPLMISATIGSTTVNFTEGLTGVGVGPQVGFTPALIVTVAGNGTLGYTGDGGVASAAEFQQPFGVAVDYAGDVFVSDSSKDVVRRVDGQTNIITTITGNGTAGYTGDLGAANAATLHSPTGLSFDAAGNLYIADSGNQAIRRIDETTGLIATFAGSGVAAYAGDGAAATSASLHTPKDVALDDTGSLFISDSANNALRRVDATSLDISSAAGNGSPGVTGNGGLAVNALLNNPAAIAVNTAGDVYIADDSNNVIRKIAADGRGISVVAGTGTAGFSGDGGLATSARFGNPQGLAVDAAGNLYIADSANNVLRKVSVSTQNVSTIAGDATSNTAGYSGDNAGSTSALLNTPTHPALDAAGNIYFADSANGVVRVIIPEVAPLAFGSVHVSSASAAQDVTVTNNGNSALVISGLTPPTDFNISGAHTTCTTSTTLAPGASCILGVVFAPTATGSLSETIGITDNEGTQNIFLSGSGLVSAIATTTTLTVPSPPLVSGQVVALTATVAPAPTGSAGTVSFFDGVTLLGTANVNSSGIATFSAHGLADGAHSLTAVYSGNSTSATSTSVAVVITLTAPSPSLTTTTTTLTVPAAPLVSGQAVTLTATVAPAPTGSSKGTVSFFDGTTLLGTSNVGASGVATFSAQGLADGDHHITAVYSGNSTSAVSTSAVVTITLVPSTPQFNVTAPTAPVAATPGTPVDVTIGVPPIGTFNSKVTMSASGLPVGATATFNPPVVTPGTGGATTVMTVMFATTASAMRLPTAPPRTPVAPLAPLALFAAAALGLCAMFGGKLSVRFPRPLTAVLTTACLLVASVVVVGCNGGFAGPPAAGPQTVVVTVTGTSGSIKHSTTVTIHLQ